MNLLLDTHILLWAAGEPQKLPEPCANLIINPDNNLLFSAASLWEISIKSGMGRTDFQVDASRLRRMLLLNAYRELPITGEHAVMVGTLPQLHKDPFDRMLIAQARTESIMLITADSNVSAYGANILKV